jgi:hypothetical protein
MSQWSIAGSDRRVDGKHCEPSMVEPPESVAPSVRGGSEVDPDDDIDEELESADLGHAPSGFSAGEKVTLCMSSSGNTDFVLVDIFGMDCGEMLGSLKKGTVDPPRHSWQWDGNRSPAAFQASRNRDSP